MKSVPSSSGDGTKRKKSEPPAARGPREGIPSGVQDAGGLNSGIRVLKKPRAPEIIEAEITDLEKRTNDLSNEMSKPEVARDITKLVAVNDAYEQAQARLAELYDEWERAESAMASSIKEPSRK
jgi:L-arabinose isomerase